jgi:hypothetical protein
MNDAGRLARDPVMRAIIGREGLERAAASPLSATCIDRVHARKPPEARIVRHGRCLVFQLAEVAVPLALIARSSPDRMLAAEAAVILGMTSRAMNHGN